MDDREGATAIEAFVKDRDVPCPGCGYNLRGIRGGACPECGVTPSMRHLTLFSRADAVNPQMRVPGALVLGTLVLLLAGMFVFFLRSVTFGTLPGWGTFVGRPAQVWYGCAALLALWWVIALVRARQRVRDMRVSRARHQGVGAPGQSQAKTAPVASE